MSESMETLSLKKKPISKDNSVLKSMKLTRDNDPETSLMTAE